MQTPSSQRTDAKVQHHNKAQVLLVLPIGTFEDKHTKHTPGVAVNQEARFCSHSSAVILTGEMEETQRNTKREKQNKHGQYSNNRTFSYCGI